MNQTKEETIKDEVVNCAYCGGETGTKMIGDEVYDWCKDCDKPTLL